jgi:hypothetical protein
MMIQRFVLSTSTAQTQAACPPTNDNLANAIAIECGNNYTGNTVAATLDENDAPDGFGADMDAPNVWYSFTGSGFSETVTLNLCGSSYDSFCFDLYWFFWKFDLGWWK